MLFFLFSFLKKKKTDNVLEKPDISYISTRANELNYNSRNSFCWRIYGELKDLINNIVCRKRYVIQLMTYPQIS